MTEAGRRARVLVTGWPSFVQGEATAGDVLAMEAVRRALEAAGYTCDLAWSPVFRPGELTLGAADPARYTHLVFCCGPLHGAQIEELHARYPRCRRLAVGVSVTGAADPAALGFHAIIARDAPDVPRRDLAAEVRVPGLPVAAVILAADQPEYGARGRHHGVAGQLTGWLAGRGPAWVPLDTRLDTRGWPSHATAAQVEAVIRRVDVVLTTRLHGLVLALKNGVPALAVDPVAGGAKVAAQARAWDWPVIVPRDGVVEVADLDRLWEWCLSPEAAKRSAAARGWPQGTATSGAGHPMTPLTADLLRVMNG